MGKMLLHGSLCYGKSKGAHVLPSGHAAPPVDILKEKRDCAILAVFLYHGLRREELCTLKVGDMQPRLGVLHLLVKGKGGKVRCIPAHPRVVTLIDEYLEANRHRDDLAGALFRPVRNRCTGGTDKAPSPRIRLS